MVNRYKLNRALIKTNSNELLYGKSSIKCHLSDNQLKYSFMEMKLHESLTWKQKQI